jgi:hypothetical protein
MLRLGVPPNLMKPLLWYMLSNTTTHQLPPQNILSVTASSGVQNWEQLGQGNLSTQLTRTLKAQAKGINKEIQTDWPH